MKGKGFRGKAGDRGDQLVTLEIQLPENLDELRRLEGWIDSTDVRNRLGVWVIRLDKRIVQSYGKADGIPDLRTTTGPARP